MKIALLQITAEDTPEKTKQKGIEYCRRSKDSDADIALFPEMFSCGYRIIDRDPDEWTKEAVKENDGFVIAFRDLARELSMAIGITILEEHSGGPRNTLIVFDRYGKKVLKYSKVHTCDFGDERYLTPGDDFYCADLDTGTDTVKVGAMICYDREFPESARILMLRGAELILVPNACPMEINRLSQLRGRAYENMLAIATCNYPESVPDCNRHSSVFDGVAYLPDLEGSRDTCILEADGKEGIFIADLDLNMLRKYRKTEVHGNAYRHPEKYGILCEKGVEEPFVRDDRRD